MKKILSLLLVLVMLLTVTGCSGTNTTEAALKEVTVGKVTLELPEDSGEFSDSGEGSFELTNDSYSISIISTDQVVFPIEQWTQELFDSQLLTDEFEGIKIESFENPVELNGNQAVKVKLVGEESGNEKTVYAVLLYSDEGKSFHFIGFELLKGKESSVSKNIEKILASIKA